MESWWWRKTFFFPPTYCQSCSPLRSQPVKVELHPVHLKAGVAAGWEVATKHTSNKVLCKAASLRIEPNRSKKKKERERKKKKK